MKIDKINSITIKQSQSAQNPKKNELIDLIANNIRNPRDVEDCVAVPRGIFKAYIYLMIGSSLMLSAAALPQKWKITKCLLNIASAACTATSAVYFAKPFAVKGLSPTVKREDYLK